MKKVNRPILGVESNRDVLKTDLTDIEEFNSAPWCVNGHCHTIGRSLFSRLRYPYHRRVEITTPDDDFLDLDIYKAASSRPVIVLFHGLEGSSKRFYITELVKDFAQLDYTVIGVNFRGCSGRINRQPRFYHCGETDDYETVFGWVEERFPDAPIGAVGFSLGGNALIKSLAEMRSDHPVTAAVAVSVPYDLEVGSRHISEGVNRIYEYGFIHTMKKKLKLKRERYPELPEFEGSTLYEYDDQVTAPLHGFDGALDYYRSCSAKRFLKDVTKPTLLIHSRQDPICPPEMIPHKKIESNDALSYVITEQGGHVGFWSQPSGWLNRIISTFLSELLG